MSSPSLDWFDWLRPQPPTGSALSAVQPGAEVVVYGAGTAAESLISVLTRRGVKVRAVLDAKSSRAEIAGLRVERPSDARFSPADRARLPVLLGIFNAFVDITALQRDLAAGGWKIVVDFPELHSALPKEIGDRYWLTERGHASTCENAIAAVDALWADQPSRLLYRALLRYRATGDRSGLPPPDPAHQYFPPDLPSWPKPLRLVDCGACDGDTVTQLGRLGLDVAALAAFEPDSTNFSRLVTALGPLREKGMLTLAWPCGVSDSTRLLRFRSAQGAGSAFDPGGDIVVPCVALDDVLGGFRPNLIKMDIEGAENDALTGAQATIRRDRPGLAVCVYHRPADLWELPARVASWNLGYRLYLRSHQYNGFDVVLYAVPTSP